MRISHTSYTHRQFRIYCPCWIELSAAAPQLLPPSLSLRAAGMPPAKPSAEEASQDWVKSHFETWNTARGGPAPRTTEELKDYKTADTWGVQAAIARERARQEVDEERSKTGASSSQAGAARPAFAQQGLELDEAKALWKSLTNTAFGMKGEFEPQKHVSFVAGRPVVAIGPVEISTGRSALSLGA